MQSTPSRPRRPSHLPTCRPVPVPSCRRKSLPDRTTWIVFSITGRCCSPPGTSTLHCPARPALPWSSPSSLSARCAFCFLLFLLHRQLASSIRVDYSTPLPSAHNAYSRVIAAPHLHPITLVPSPSQCVPCRAVSRQQTLHGRRCTVHGAACVCGSVILICLPVEQANRRQHS